MIRGKLISEANGVVEFKHAILGDLKINRALITDIASTPQVELKPSELTSIASHTHTLSEPIEKNAIDTNPRNTDLKNVAIFFEEILRAAHNAPRDTWHSQIR